MNPPTATAGRLAIDELTERESPTAEDVDAFLAGHSFPIVEGPLCTFVFRGEADEVHIAQRIVGLPNLLPLKRLDGTDLWYLVLELPRGSRIEYQVAVRRGDHHERFNDPLNPELSNSPMGQSSVCFAYGYETPEWTLPDEDSRPGEMTELVLHSDALDRETHVPVYLPARFRRTASYPLLVVHDGNDFVNYASAKVVLDNLIHRLDIAEMVVAFSNPGDRLGEYANSEAHARYVSEELVPHLEEGLPLVGQPSGRCLLGSSFGAIASLSTAYRSPDQYGSLVLMSGSFVFTDIATDHGGGPEFDPVVEFVNRFRARPQRVADRIYMSCGVYEPLIVPNRAMVLTLEAQGIAVRFDEVRDGHSWENWRDRLRAALSFVYPGPQKLVYE
jgi:enterochelin esterase family protein